MREWNSDMTHDNIIYDLSKKFALRVIRLYVFLSEERKEYVMSKQIYRSGTSIGANIAESINAQSKADFVSKLSISLKEASESEFWIELLRDTDYITTEQAESMLADCQELLKLLMTIVKTSKQ